MKLKNVLSCFDGASCAQMALNRAGISYQKYYASEIDESAIAVTQKNYPNTIQLGSILDLDLKKLPKMDAVFAGSPCTDLSRAGKRSGMVTEDGIQVTSYDQYVKLKKQKKKFVGQSYLFWEFVGVLKVVKPKHFFLENTKMDPLWMYIITKELGVEPIFLNSSILTAQNRERYYWTNLPGFVFPQDKGVKFNQIVKGAVSCGYRGRKNKGETKYRKVFTTRKDGKANCLVTSPGNTNLYIKNNIVKKISIDHAEKLQTWPIGYTNIPGLSKSARYKMIGNGWTTDIVAHFLKCAKRTLVK